ncbi:MAG: hypothetical protein ABGY75_22735, partial [Gemmataceae bacterium]
MRRLAVAYLALQAIGAFVWWLILLAVPSSRPYFRSADAPDSALLAFGVADAVLYIGTSALAAIGLHLRRRWAWPVLCVHAGAAGYAAGCCFSIIWAPYLPEGGGGGRRLSRARPP